MALIQLIEKAKKIQEKPKENRLELLLSDKKKETKSVYLCQINKFHSWKKKLTYDKWDVLEFFKYLQEEGYSSAYIRGAYWAVKLYFESEGWLWEAKLPKIKNTQIIKPALPKEDIIKIILATNTRGTAEEKVYLALSTTYGLRRSEMANLSQQDFDFEENTIFIRTKKGGTPRKHFIPSQILNLLCQHDFSRVPSTSYISLLFKRISGLAQLKIGGGTSWHGIRHRLNIELIEAGLPEITVLSFLRWKYKTSMAQYYYTPELRGLDEQVFRVHPFLSYYGKP